MTDQRQYQRCPIAVDPPTGVLVHDRGRVQCWLTEMSLGGFAVIVSSKVTAAMNSLARLQIRGLEYIVRISRQENLGDCYLVAMVLVEEVIPRTATISDGPMTRWWAVSACTAAAGIIGAATYLIWAWYLMPVPGFE